MAEGLQCLQVGPHLDVAQDRPAHRHPVPGQLVPAHRAHLEAVLVAEVAGQDARHVGAVVGGTGEVVPGAVEAVVRRPREGLAQPLVHPAERPDGRRAGPSGGDRDEVHVAASGVPLAEAERPTQVETLDQPWDRLVGQREVGVAHLAHLGRRPPCVGAGCPAVRMHGPILAEDVPRLDRWVAASRWAPRERRGERPGGAAAGCLLGRPGTTDGERRSPPGVRTESAPSSPSATGSPTPPPPEPSASPSPRAGDPAPAAPEGAQTTREPRRSFVTIPALGLRDFPVVRYRGRPDDAPGTRIQDAGPMASPRGPGGGVGPGEVGNFLVTGHRHVEHGAVGGAPLPRAG